MKSQKDHAKFPNIHGIHLNSQSENLHQWEALEKMYLEITPVAKWQASRKCDSHLMCAW